MSEPRELTPIVVGNRLELLVTENDPYQRRVCLGELGRHIEALRAERDTLKGEVARLKKLLDRDHTGLASGMNHLQKIIKGFWWLANGEWGSYDYTQRTEETLRRELADCFEKLEETAKLALHESGLRADAAFHPERDQVADLTRQVAEAKELAEELQALFDMQHKRTVEADALWSAEHNKPLTIPDLGELIAWLLTFKTKLAASEQALLCWIDHEGKSCFLLGVDGWCGDCARCVTRKALGLPLGKAPKEPS